MWLNKIIKISNEKYKGKYISSLIKESDSKIIAIIPTILILKLFKLIRGIWILAQPQFP